jgi:DnaJ domain
MSSENLYQLLGLTPQASKEEIKEAYLLIVSEYHAQVNHAPEAEQHFRKVSEAYLALSKEGAITLYKPNPLSEANLLVEKPEIQFWQKQYSPAFMLGAFSIGITGALLGYSLQPKSIIVREVIREKVEEVEERVKKETEETAQESINKSSALKQTIIEKTSTPKIELTKLSTASQRSKEIAKNAISIPPLLPMIPRSIKVVRILPAPATFMIEAPINMGPKPEPKKNLMALPLFNPKTFSPGAVSSVPPLPSNPLLPLAKPVQQPTSYSTSYTPTVVADDYEADEKLLTKLNAYGGAQSAPSEDEDTRILSGLNSLSRASKAPSATMP